MKKIITHRTERKKAHVIPRTMTHSMGKGKKIGEHATSGPASKKHK